MDDRRRGAGTGGATGGGGRRPARPGPAVEERGKRASFDPDSGEVHGSGSGAGGGGNRREDYDSDPMAGAGAEPEGAPRRADRAAKRPVDKDEGI